MSQQQYNNHVRYYAAHHFAFYPAILVLLVICVRNYLQHTSNDNLWLMLAAMVVMIGWLSFMVRQHYALINQNRIVRLEMRLRYYQLTQKRFEQLETKLSFQQIAALRFAGDQELLPLIDKTLIEQLTPTQIKKLITDWQADHMRV